MVRLREATALGLVEDDAWCLGIRACFNWVDEQEKSNRESGGASWCLREVGKVWLIEMRCRASFVGSGYYPCCHAGRSDAIV